MGQASSVLARPIIGLVWGLVTGAMLIVLSPKSWSGATLSG